MYRTVGIYYITVWGSSDESNLHILRRWQKVEISPQYKYWYVQLDLHYPTG